jgi:tetratricopeptide (TPR) repeat protein
MTRSLTICLVALPALLPLLLLPAPSALADTLVLTDGTEVEGQVSRSGDRYGVITDEGVRWFDAAQVKEIKYDPLKTADAETKAAFMTAKAQAARQKMPAQAVEVWQGYVAANPKSPLLEAAEDEIRRWQKAEALGLVIWAGKAIQAEERDEAQRKAFELIDEGIRLHSEDKHREAKRQFDRADRLWPNHPTVDFYAALVLRHLRQPVTSVGRLVDVLEEMPEHVPSLNNASVICAQIHDYSSSVLMMARALRRDPENEVLLENAWELLHMMEVEKKGSVMNLNLKKVKPEDMKVLEEACQAHKNRQALDDRFRWGSEWVTRQTLEDHLTDRRAAKARLAEFAKEVKALQVQVDAVDNRIAVAQKMREASLQAGNGRGALLMQRQVRDMLDEKGDLVEDQNRIRERARNVLKDMPTPPWSGRMDLLSVESPLEAIKSGQETTEAIRKAILTGQVRIVGGDDKPLGRVSVEPHHPRSIWNPLGPHGSPYSKQSLFDPSSPYGRLMSYLSCRDEAAAQPPKLMLGDDVLCYLTVNKSFEPRMTLESLIGTLRRQK